MLNEKLLQEVGNYTSEIKKSISEVIIGQEEIINGLLISIFSGGHCLLVGVPGLAKSLMISSLAKVLNLDFNRIQFTPDLMPSDITGSEILEENKTTGEKFFKFVKGPVFANIILADEINRTPPKTQSALLEAMQEKQVSFGGENYQLPQPFFVLATQNPIEQEGTYPLPEAQLDRFMVNLVVDYPSLNEEKEIVKKAYQIQHAELTPVLNAEILIDIQKQIQQMPVADFIIDYAVKLTRMTRPINDNPYDFVKKYIVWGAGPRASQFLILAAKTKALMEGRLAPSIEDVKDIAHIVLRHRLILNFTAEAEGVTVDKIIELLLENIKND